MPRWRFTVRRMMVAVAIVAIPLALVRWVLREDRGRQLFNRAYEHKNLAYNIWVIGLYNYQREIGGEGLDTPLGDSPDLNDSPAWAALIARCPPEKRALLVQITERRKYHKRMQAKWDRACRNPWGTVPADPPPPPVDASLSFYPFKYKPLDGM